VEAKTFGGNNIIKITTSYLINEDSDEANREVERSVREGVADITGLPMWKMPETSERIHFLSSVL
jgi:SecD/SecF fusion protein